MDDFGPLNTSSYDASGVSGSRDEYGQGLFDFDLAWTFDFLDKNDGSHVDFSETYDDSVRTVTRTNNADDWLSTTLDEGVAQPRWPDKSLIDSDEVNQVLNASPDALLKATAVDENLRALLWEIVTSDSRELLGTVSSPPRVFPDNRSLQYFLLLYINLVHPRFPAIHIPTFSTTKTPAVVLMGMMLAGSCHSATNGDRFCCDYLDRCRYWLAAARERNLKTVRTWIFQDRPLLTFRIARQPGSHVCTVLVYNVRYVEW